MTQLLQPANTHARIERRDVTVSADPHEAVQFTDDAELRVAVQFIEASDAWIGTAWASLWREADILYQALRSNGAWEGTQQARANISRFTVAKLVNAIVPQLVKGLFYEQPPFKLRGYPGTDEAVIRAKEAVFAALLNEDFGDYSFRAEVEEGLQASAIFGPVIMVWGWEERVRTRKRYVRKGKGLEQQTPVGVLKVATKESLEWELKPEEERLSRPFLRYVDHRSILFDPRWNRPDIRKCPRFGIRKYLTFDELDELREEPGYEIPPREDLLDLFFPPAEQTITPGTAEASTAGASRGVGGAMHAMPRYESTGEDPLERSLEYVELWDRGKCRGILQRKLCIKKTDDEFGCNPGLSSNWWNVPDSGIGIGLGRIVGQDQRVDTGLINACLDILSHAVNPDYIRGEGVNVLTQNIRQRLGGVIAEAKDPKNAFVLKEQPRVPPEALAVLQLSKAESESASGANEQLVQGATPAAGRSSLGRTATGAAGLIAGAASRLEGPLERFINQVFIPYLYKMDELINERMPSDQLNKIVGKALGAEFQFDEEKFRNAELEFEVLAGAHLAAKKAMAGVLPLLVELFANPAVAQQLAEVNGEYADFGLLVRSIMEAAEWRYNDPFVKPLTEEMKQRLAQKNAASAKFQQQLAMAQQQHQFKGEENDQKAQNRLAEKVTVLAAEHGLEPDNAT